MPRIPLIALNILTITLLTACSGSDSTEFPEDGREQSNPIDNRNEDIYAGRALDGYLRDAFVWLDMDQDGQWETGEPSTTTGEGGRFVLDVTSLQRDITEGVDLDPRNYPLMLLAIPGQTVDESTGQPVDRGYLLMSPPGVDVITPYTTLIEFERRLVIFNTGTLTEQVKRATLRVRERLGAELDGFSLQGDYLRGDNPRAARYAEALTAFMEAQTQDAWSTALANGERDIYNDDLINILGGVVLVQAPDVIDQATALLDEGGVENFDVSQLVLNQFDLDVTNPFVLTSQKVYVDNEFTPASDPEEMEQSRATLVGYGSSQNVSAELAYFYDSFGRLTAIDVEGWTDPEFTLLRPLIAVRGQVSLLQTQYGPGPFVRYSTANPENGPAVKREHYMFDWQNGRIEWDTTNPAFGAAVAELDGVPEQVFTWERDTENRVVAIDLATPSGDLTAGFEVDYGTGGEPAQYRFLNAAGATVETWMLQDGVTACPEDDPTPRTVNYVESIDVYLDESTAGEPARTYSLGFRQLEDDMGEKEEPRLLKEVTTIDYPAVGPQGVSWFYLYFDDSTLDGVLDEQQPALLQEKLLTLGADGACNGNFSSAANSALAVVQFAYSRLSVRLTEQAEAE